MKSRNGRQGARTLIHRPVASQTVSSVVVLPSAFARMRTAALSVPM